MASFFKDLFSGNFTAAWGDITAALDKLPPWVKQFLQKLEGQEGVILSGLVATATADLMQDVTHPSALTSVQIGTQAKAIYAQLVSQNISTFTIQDVFSALNGSLSAQTPSVPVTAPVDPTPPPAPIETPVEQPVSATPTPEASVTAAPVLNTPTPEPTANASNT